MWKIRIEIFLNLELPLPSQSQPKSIFYQNQPDPSQEPMAPPNHVSETMSSSSRVLEPMTKGNDTFS